MGIELTAEQSAAVAAAAGPVAVTDPRTGRAYRLVAEEEFARGRPYDDSPWSPAETGRLASEAFGKLDDTDYREYLGDAP
ncbi:MAG: hypothetical protein C0501_03315 [Isosphaera sp.]|nr:hypothetical protein [Isosphaera sp.]